MPQPIFFAVLSQISIARRANLEVSIGYGNKIASINSELVNWRTLALGMGVGNQGSGVGGQGSM